MAKINPADAEVQGYMELQRRTASRCRIADLMLIAVLSAMIAVMGIAIFILPQSTFSEDENRDLTTFPAFSIQSLIRGDWTKKISEFYADQFPVRRLMVQLKATCELAQFKGQNNKVILGANDTLISRLEYPDYSNVENNMAAVNDLQIALAKENIPVCMAVAPRAIDIFAAELPVLYGSERSDAVWDVITAYRPDATRLRNRLLELHKEGEYVWYRTDHHWTTDGAYAAYEELGQVLGYTPYKTSDFERTRVSDEFYGTTYSKSGMYFVAPDSMYFYRYEGDEGYVVKNMRTGAINTGFYFTGFLSVKDKYSAFIGENQAHVRVYDATEKSEDKPTLVLVKDSFANSVVPFLARHYDLEIIDLRYYTGSVARLAREKNACGVLILIGADSLASSDDLTQLRLGLGS